MHAKEYYYLNFLNENCPVDGEWTCDDKAYQIIVDNDAEDKISDWLSKIVGCSFVYVFTDDGLTGVKVSKSTLMSKLK